MALHAPLILTLLLSPIAPAPAPTSEPVPVPDSHSDKWQITYLARSGKLGNALDLYEKNASDEHDFELLEQLGLLLLEQGARSEDPKVQLASIYGAHLAGAMIPLDILEEGVRSKSPETQIACIQTLAAYQDDRSDDLLIKAMSSPFLPIRLEAGYYLSMRKHPAATGQLEALLTRIPPFFHFVFPEFFAVIGTKESISILRDLMDDPDMGCKTEAILSAARHQRDDLLTAIRKKATHHHPALQEATASALALLQDASSMARLKKLAANSSSNVRLAAAKGLVQFGDTESKKTIQGLVEKQDLYAIHAAGELELCRDLLADLAKEEDLQIRINAAIALLNARDERAWPALSEILLRDMRDLGIVMNPSPGRSLASWKIIPSLQQRQEVEFADLFAITIAVREQLLKDCLNLGETTFLQIAHAIFDRRQAELIPLLCHLLESLRTKDAIALLKEKTLTAGSPLIRTYAALSLFRIGVPGPYEGMLKDWLLTHNKEEILRFRPMLPFHKRPAYSPYELSPEETSRLLIEIYQAIADQHTKEGIDLLLKAIRQNGTLNRYALAGLLLRALQ